MKWWELAEINREQEAEGGAAGTPTSLRAFPNEPTSHMVAICHSLDMGQKEKSRPDSILDQFLQL